VYDPRPIALILAIVLFAGKTAQIIVTVGNSQLARPPSRMPLLYWQRIPHADITDSC